MPKTKVKPKGGPREGSGRKTIYDKPLVRHMVRIGEHHEEIIAQVSPGNFNRGLLLILDDPAVIAAIRKSFKI